MANKRIRMTNRRAAQPPASYGWEPEHPAHKADPEADAYLIDNDGNGTGSEPSDFAEDVAPAPYAQGAAPASYGWEPEHPAAKADAKGAAPSEKKAALQRKAAERKAAKCIRIAQALLGQGVDTDTIEDQAVDLMDLSSNAINATMDRLSGAFLADEDIEAYSRAQNDSQLGYGGEKAADDADMVAEELLAQMLVEEEEPEASLYAEDEVEATMPMLSEDAHEATYAEDEVEACGDSYAGMEAGDDEVEAMLSEMLAPEAHDEHEHEADELLETEPMQDGEIGLEMMAEDPMGLGDEVEANDEMLAQLFGGRMAADDEDADADADEKADDADDADEKEGGKKAASLKPKARKASKGARSLGSVTKSASSEVNDLSKLWSVAPDVSDVFGN